MKTLYLILIVLLSTNAGFGQSLTRAKENETVWVIVQHVKADKREQFENFIHNVFWPASTKLSEDEQRVFKQTRTMHAGKADPDGTYPYIFIMDPVVAGGDYDVESLLTKMFGAEKAAEHYKTFTDTMDRESNNYEVTQSKR
ncbi:hypothetical protein [Dyadobacter sp. LHD-138]|uniref:hypothetical protein n=1 Tax=Dyadobacter sp. LHD-138 TaxID=3071413 RepID=UPI0027DECFEA|nr:hypothetical protein [Dyadobacter sp. LHD-138]MDQ6479046.1 hypothetical protein [Dyadobacter sp. LHD-138]